MDDEKLTKIYNFEAEISEDGTISIPKEELKSLKEKGYKKVQIVFFGSAKEAVNDQGIDSDFFEKIRDLQTLPDTVVLEFLKSKGSLRDKKYLERINFE